MTNINGITRVMMLCLTLLVVSAGFSQISEETKGIYEYLESTVKYTNKQIVSETSQIRHN